MIRLSVIPSVPLEAPSDKSSKFMCRFSASLDNAPNTLCVNFTCSFNSPKL